MADENKITISFNVVYLNRIDLLVDQGFYSTRTDSIRAAIRIRLNTRTKTIEGAVTRRATGLNELNFTGE